MVEAGRGAILATRSVGVLIVRNVHDGDGIAISVDECVGGSSNKQWLLRQVVVFISTIRYDTIRRWLNGKVGGSG